MADDRMKNDDRQRNMGTKDDQDFGQQSPGRRVRLVNKVANSWQ